MIFSAYDVGESTFSAGTVLAEKNVSMLGCPGPYFVADGLLPGLPLPVDFPVLWPAKAWARTDEERASIRATIRFAARRQRRLPPS